MIKSTSNIVYKRTGSSDIIGIYEQFYKLYGWTYWDIMCIPIPVFFDTLEALKKRLEREQKELEKSKKKNRGRK